MRLPRFWTHVSPAPDRRAAVEAMYDYYDAHRGRRRTPARDAFEVFRVRKTDVALVLYVRRRKRGAGAGDSTPNAEEAVG